MNFGSLRISCVALLCVLLLGCGGKNYNSNSSTNAPVTAGNLRMFNALPDSPTLLVGLDGTTLTRVSYGQSTALRQLITGKYALNAQYLDPAGATVAVVNKEQFTLNKDEQVSVFLLGTLSSPRTKYVVEPAPSISAGSAQVQVMQAAANAGTLDVYLSDAAASLASATKVATVAFEQLSDLATLTSGNNYRLRVTAPGSTTVLYDSGAFTLDDQSRSMFVVVEYFGPGGSGFRVVQVNTQSAATFAQEALPGALRIANMISDAPSVDLYLGPVGGAPAFAGVAFASASTRLQVVPGDLPGTLTVAGAPGNVLYSGTVSVSPGETRTVVFTRSGSGVAARATVDATRPVAGEGQLQFVNAAPSAGSLDAFLVKTGQALADTATTVNNQPVLAIAGGRAAPATYDVVFTATGSKTVVAGPTPLGIVARSIHTVFAADAAGGGAPQQIVVTDD